MLTSSLPLPFCKPDGGTRLNRAEGVQAIRRSSVLGKGVYLSTSALGAHAGSGLFVSRDFKVGDVITVYDGIVSPVGAMLYDATQQAFFDPKLATEHTTGNPAWGFTGKQFQSHWKDGGSAPGATVVIHGFGGWPLQYCPVGLGAGAMVNAVFSCKGRIGQGDPLAREARRIAAQGQPRKSGSKLAQRLGWATSRRKKRPKKVAVAATAAVRTSSEAAAAETMSTAATMTTTSPKAPVESMVQAPSIEPAPQMVAAVKASPAAAQMTFTSEQPAATAEASPVPSFEQANAALHRSPPSTAYPEDELVLQFCAFSQSTASTARGESHALLPLCGRLHSMLYPGG